MIEFVKCWIMSLLWSAHKGSNTVAGEMIYVCSYSQEQSMSLSSDACMFSQKMEMRAVDMNYPMTSLVLHTWW